MSKISPVKNVSNFDCKFISYWLDEAVKIFMQVFFVVSFLSLFFFLYVVKVEKEVFVDQVQYVVNDLYNGFSPEKLNPIVPPIYQPYIKKQLYDYVSNVQIPPQDNQSIESQNNEVIDKTKEIVVIIGTVLFSVVTALIILRFCTNLSHQFLENIIVLAFMGLSEFAVLNLVTRNYIASNPNHVRLYFLQGVVEYANSKKN